MSKRNLVWMGVIVAIMALFYWLTPRAAQEDTVVRTFAPLVEADAMVRRHFVEEVSEDELVDGAIRGMMLQLDPYSRYIAPEEMDAFERALSANYDGIGVTIGMRHDQVTVIAPVEESPAARAGILAGDVILAVDGKSTEGMTVLDVNARLVGDPGTPVTLTLRHPGSDEPVEITVVRGPIAIRPVKGFRRLPHANHNGWDYLLDPEFGIGCIRVADFRDNTTVEFDKALSALTSQGVRAIILDLRFNGGGLLPRAVEMVDRFVREGDIVSVVTRNNTAQRFRAKPEGTLEHVELAVLINGASASAAEIVAGALQDCGRAVVVGTRSFGKGSVQHDRYIRVHGRRAAIRMTEAHWVLPGGRVIHRTPRNADTDEWGVIPDVEVPITEEERRRVQRERRVVDATFHSTATRPAATTGPAGADAAGGREPPPEIWLDPQLQAALERLRDRLTSPEGPERPSPDPV
jgi:carboxyl-terminal processing protease